MEDILAGNNQFPLWGFDYCIDNNKIWFAHGSINALFCGDLLSGKTEFKSFIPDCEHHNGQYQFYSIKVHKDKVYLIPAHAETIIIYHVKNATFSKLELIDGQSGKFCMYFVIENNLYCFPLKYNYITVIDMETDSVEYRYNMNNVISREIDFSFYMPVQWDNKYMIGLISMTNKIVFYNILQNEASVVEVGDAGLKFYCMALLKNCLYLYDKSAKKLVKYSLNTKKIVKCIDINLDFQYGMMYGIDDCFLYLYTFSGKWNVIYISPECEIVKQETVNKNEYEMYEHVYSMGKVFKAPSGKDIFANYWDNTLYKIEGLEMKKYCTLYLSEEQRATVMNALLEKDFIIKENQPFGLQEYISSGVLKV